MRRISSVVVAVGMLVLTSTATLAQKGATNQTIAISDTVFNACTGESFYFEGTLHIVSRMSQDSSGGAHAGGTVTLRGEGVTASGAK